jgi:hypothetical protein
VCLLDWAPTLHREDPGRNFCMSEEMRTPGVEPGPLAGQDPKFERRGRQRTRPDHSGVMAVGLAPRLVVSRSPQLFPVSAQVRQRCNALCLLIGRLGSRAVYYPTLK